MTTTPGAPTPYRRVGLVSALRLVEGREWTTSNGDILLGEPGDWLVASPDGGERTVSDPAFRISYEHVQGNEYRRVGSVLAVRTSSEVVVETLEGGATALPGDWIVTAPDGTSWPVPDAVFRATYESAVTPDCTDPSDVDVDSDAP